MSVTYAPSKLSYLLKKIINKALTLNPTIARFCDRRKNQELYALSRKAARLDFSINVLNSRWATEDYLIDEYNASITRELVKIDKIFGSTMKDGIPPALHWSRRYEYPYAIINSNLCARSNNLKILDCGAGISPLQFYLANKGFQVYSLDLNLSDLEHVALFKLKKKLKSLHPTYGNILDLPFPNDYFDRIFSISVLEHLIHGINQKTNVIFEGFIKEMLRVLKPKGLVILTFDVNINPNESNLRLYPSEWQSICKILGIPSDLPPRNRLCS